MIPISHIVEPVGLALTWQLQDEQSETRTRRVVGEISRNEAGEIVFRYLKDTDDFRKAEAAGFKGYPAFEIKGGEIASGVIESFLRRLPPRKREDFSDFLALHRLPHPFNHSDIALLGYTGARLPSDGFALVPIFPANASPCEYIMEVAGFRHAPGAKVENLTVGDQISFAIDEGNPVDQDAIAVIHNGTQVGYVNRAMRSTFRNWLDTRNVTATIERLNGKPERPLVYVRVTAS